MWISNRSKFGSRLTWFDAALLVHWGVKCQRPSEDYILLSCVIVRTLPFESFSKNMKMIILYKIDIKDFQKILSKNKRNSSSGIWASIHWSISPKLYPGAKPGFLVSNEIVRETAYMIRIYVLKENIFHRKPTLTFLFQFLYKSQK